MFANKLYRMSQTNLLVKVRSQWLEKVGEPENCCWSDKSDVDVLGVQSDAMGEVGRDGSEKAGDQGP